MQPPWKCKILYNTQLTTEIIWNQTKMEQVHFEKSSFKTLGFDVQGR